MSCQHQKIKGKKLLFICLGNICRSPIAEAVFKYYLKENRPDESWEIDSAALENWHKGNLPDYRAINVMKTHNILTNHRARQIRKKDFKYYDIIFGMDHENIRELKRLSPENSTSNIELFGTYDSEKELVIRDPYYDDDDEGFEKCYEQCVRCTKGYLDSLIR